MVASLHPVHCLINCCSYQWLIVTNNCQRNYTFSTIMATPWPTPTHMAAKP